MHLSDLQKLFVELDFHPSRKLGQNFLIDQNVAAWIVRQLSISPGDTVVEAGPGAGALTHELLSQTENLVLVEFDHRLAEFLKGLLAHRPSVSVLHGDACQFDTRDLFPRQPVRFIGNLPYSAGGEIIRNFLGAHSPVTEAVLMVQREVAERIAAKPRTKDFSVLTLRVQCRWNVRVLKHLGPECFFPRPKIDSTVIHLTRKEPGSMPVFDAVLFDRLIRQGFAQRRKQLRNALQLSEPEWQGAIQGANIAPLARAEELELAQWIQLTQVLDPHPLKHHAQKGDEIFDVVDENDIVTGQSTRDTVHRSGLRHRAVHLFVFNRAGELFLQKRSHLKDVHPGAWDSSAAGHLDAGEEYADAARRELQEELGLTGEVEEIARLPASAQTGHEFVRLYRAEAHGKIRWPASEIEFGQFFPLRVIAHWIEARPGDFAGGFLACWDAARIATKDEGQRTKDE